MQFGALLHRAWDIDQQDPEQIIGYWAEDDCPYKMVVPSQLRNSLVHMQNILSDLYVKVQSKERELHDLKMKIKSVLGFSCTEGKE
jgi:hypothetical protein